MKQLFTLLLCLLCTIIYSQSRDSIFASEYYLKMNNTLNLRMGISNDVNSFRYFTSDTIYSIEPNTSLKLRASINYRFISLAIGISPKFLANHDVIEYGNTVIFDLRFNFFIQDWMQSFNVNRTEGYYASAIENMDGDFNQEPDDVIILPDLKTFSITSKTQYRFNENYSFKAAFNQNEIQTISTGSFVPSLTIGYYEIKDETSIQDSESIRIKLNAGYFYTFALNNHWYSNLGVDPGIGIEFNNIITRVEQEEFNDRYNNLAFDLNAHIGLGYNSGKFYGGMTLIGSAFSRDDNAVMKFDNSRGYINFFLGYRFKAPKSFEKGMDWLEARNPFRKKE